MNEPYPPHPEPLGSRGATTIQVQSSACSSPWRSLPIQFFGGGAVLGVVLALLALFHTGETYDGLVSFVGAFIVGGLLAICAMICAVIAGLPLRIFPALRLWWQSYGWLVAFVCALLGIAGIILSYAFGSELFVPSGGAGVPESRVRDPQPVAYFGSILLAALGLTHLLPRPRTDRLVETDDTATARSR